jgi:hypothetical protein
MPAAATDETRRAAATAVMSAATTANETRCAAAAAHVTAAATAAADMATASAATTTTNEFRRLREAWGHRGKRSRKGDNSRRQYRFVTLHIRNSICRDVSNSIDTASKTQRGDALKVPQRGLRNCHA